MKDFETDPQRPGALSPEGPSHGSSDASRDPGPARDEPDRTAQLRPDAHGLDAQGTDATAGDATAGDATAGEATGQLPTLQQPVAPQPPAGPAQPHGGWQAPTGPQQHGWQPGRPPYGPQQGAYAQPGLHGPAQPGPYGQPQTGPYSPAQPGSYGQPQPGPYGQPHPGLHGGAQPGSAPPWQQGDTAHGVPADDPALPPWATPVAGPERRPGRGRKILAAGAAAVVLALGAGGFGAWAALALSDDTGGGTITTANSAVTRVVDRSSLAQIAEQVQPSVVSIAAGSGSGSGVVLTADGYILSNNHVVAAAQGDTVRVAFADGKTATARIIGTDPRTDLAVVKASGVSGLKPAAFGSSADIKVGDSVLALGSPLGLEGSVTYGIVSAKDRTIRSGADGQPDNPFDQQPQQRSATSISGLLQTDAAINPGNSGGALVNTNGELVGVNTAIATSGQSTGNIGVGFAIPSDKARTVADALMKGQKVSHPYLGVNLTESTTGTGAVVAGVTANSPADKAGLRQGDVITKIGDKPVGDSDDVISAVQAGTVGGQIEVTYSRNGQQGQATATLAEAP